MNVLILGANGFIGQNLVNQINNRPEKYNLTLVSRSQFNLKLPSGTKRIIGDYKDRKILKLALKNQDIVYHLISETLPFNSWDLPMTEVDKNLIPFLCFLEICSQEKISKIVYLSSGGAVYGQSLGRLKETDAPFPYVPYGIIKLTMEHFLRYANNKFGIDYYILRVSNVFGPGQTISKGLGFINTVLEAAQHNTPVQIYGDGENKRDYIYIHDLTSIIQPNNILKSPPNNIVNIASGMVFSQNEIISIIQESIDKKLKINYMPKRKSDIRQIELDNSKIFTFMPEFQFTDFNQALKNTFLSLQLQVF